MMLAKGACRRAGSKAGSENLKPMELVISIVSWNTCELLRTCLASLVPRCRAGHTRVVVVDNASSDGTPEMIRSEFPEVTLLESGANLGFGKAHNLIAAHSDEPFVLFLNPDTEFVEDAHERMLEVFEQHGDVALVGCRMTNLDGSVQPLGCQLTSSPWTEFAKGLVVSKSTMPLARRLLRYPDPLASGFVNKIYGGCIMARREVLDEHGWFDERFFMYAEDVDLSRRAQAAGWRSYYLSSARVIHLCGGASEKAPGRFATLMQRESMAKLMEKYYGRIGKGAYVAGTFLISLLRVSLVGVAKFGLRILRRPVREGLEDSLRKNLAMLRWALGLERPSIPG